MGVSVGAFDAARDEDLPVDGGAGRSADGDGKVGDGLPGFAVPRVGPSEALSVCIEPAEEEDLAFYLGSGQERARPGEGGVDGGGLRFGVEEDDLRGGGSGVVASGDEDSVLVGNGDVADSA